MFEITKVGLEEKPELSQEQCELAPRKTHLCVRPECCTSHQGLAGIDVHLGAVEAAGSAEKTFVLDEVKYGVILTQATNEEGWASFKDASDQKDKTLAVWIEAPEYYPRYDVIPCETEQKREEERRKRVKIAAKAVTLSEEHHTIVTAILRSESPLLPADFDAKVEAMAKQMTRVRLLVDHGPNLGNQSAALSLIGNLRRVGFTGPIDALVDKYTMIETWHLDLKFTIPIHGSDLEKVDERAAAVKQKLLDRYADTKADVLTNKPWLKKLELRAEDDETIFTLAPGEELRLATCFKDLPFAYTLSEPTWNKMALVNLTGNTPAPVADFVGNLVVQVDFEIQTAGDESLDAKLKKLDPAYDKEGAYKDVTWTKKDGDGSLPAFDDDVSGDATIVGMVGASEANEGSVETYRRDKTKTHSLIAIQPLLWHSDNRFFRVKGDQKKTTPLCLPEAAAYFIDPLVVEDKKAVFEGQAEAPIPDALAAVLAGVGSCDLMVAYGVHQARSSSPSVVLDNLARALAKAIADGGVKKTLLLVLCKPEIELPLVHEKVIRAHLDGDLAGKIDTLGDDKILMIHAPPLPQRTFQLLAQAGTLPFLLEGANTCNMMQMLGLPYLSVCTESTPYVDVPGKDGHKKLQALTDHFNASGGQPDTRVAALAKYFTDAKDAASVLDGYFPALRDLVKKKPLDQVKWALYRLEKELAEAKVPSSKQCCSTM